MENKAALPKRRKLFETFLIIGVSSEYLDSIDEDNLFMNPQVIYSYPPQSDTLNQYDQYKRFCYHEGVSVVRYQISSEEEYTLSLLETNLYSNPIETFCFIKPSNYDTKDNQKYLFGFKFYDLHIINSKDMNMSMKHNIISVFKYEKVYLIVSTQASFQVFDAFCSKILEIKKLNFLNNLTQFRDIYDKAKYDSFLINNIELKNKEIEELLHYGNVNNYSKTLDYLALSNRTIDVNESNLAWLLRKIMGYIDPKTFYIILTMVLCEQPVLFYGDNLELITFTTIAFSQVIHPFEWKLPLIPNLPFDSIHMATSPVPFLVGILGTREKIMSMTGGVSSNMVRVSKTGIHVTSMANINNLPPPMISQLHAIIDLIFWELNGKDKKFKENITLMKEIAINASSSIYEGLCKLICEKIQKAVVINGKDGNSLEDIQRRLLSVVNKNEYQFFEEFSETEMFISYYDSLKPVKG